MLKTNTLIIGSSFSGLGSAACLTKAGIDYIIIEKEGQVAAPWRNHYQRLHLHTPKNLSALPFLPFGRDIPKFPERLQVVTYLEQYQKMFAIKPHFHTKAVRVAKTSDGWLTQTNKQTYLSQNLIIATGSFGQPEKIDIQGMETFKGKMLHSSQYNSGRYFKDRKVLVIGFGNSACEIAMDLFEQGAKPSISVRSAVNVLPREILGIPIMQLGLLMNWLPAKTSDLINAPILNYVVGDFTRYGLKKLPYGPMEQIEQHQSIPVLDIGTLKLIREGHCKVFDGVDRIAHNNVYFNNGMCEHFDAIVAAIGYKKGVNTKWLQVGDERLADLNKPLKKQQYFGNDGLYFCGFWVSPNGQIREIAMDAKKIVKDISEKLETADPIKVGEEVEIKSDLLVASF
jgi:hypothetical protein